MSKIVMTDEIRKQMAGLLPMDSKSTYSYTPDAFSKIDEAFRPVFELKQLSNEDIIEVKVLVLKELESRHTPDIEGAFSTLVDIESISEEAIEAVKVLVLKEFEGRSVTALRDNNARNYKYMKILRKALVGWSNLFDLGTRATFEDTGTINTLLLLPEAIRTDLFREALKISGFNGGR